MVFSQLYQSQLPLMRTATPDHRRQKEKKRKQLNTCPVIDVENWRINKVHRNLKESKSDASNGCGEAYESNNANFEYQLLFM